MRSCLKHTPCRWLRETLPPALSARPGAGVCSSELPLHRCWGPWSSVRGYPARARVFKWVEKRYASSASSHGKTRRAAIPPSLEHSIAISAWPPAQSEDRRRGEQKKGGERKGCFPLNCHIYLGNTSGRQSQMLHGKVRRIGKKSSCPDSPSTSSSLKAGGSGAMCWWEAVGVTPWEGNEWGHQCHWQRSSLVYGLRFVYEAMATARM